MKTKLTNRELAVMRILWEADHSLMVSEIVQKDKNGTIYSVQRIIQNLMKKNMVAIDGIAYNKKALGRTFKPFSQRRKHRDQCHTGNVQWSGQ